MNPRTYPVLRAIKSIAVDGDVSKAAWSVAPWSEPFVDIEGDKKAAPSFQTRMKMVWNDQALYIAAELEEPHVWGTLTERDSVIFQDNDFEIFIDPDGDNHHYAEFEINALGTIWDLLLPRPYKDGGMPMNGWQFKGLQSAVRIQGTINDPTDTDHGWSVEIAIPWAALKEICRCDCPPKLGDQWRINFSRVQWDHEIVDGKYRKIPDRPEHNWVWSPQGVIDMHRPERWGIIQFCDQTPEIRPDPSFEAREKLHLAYYAARDFRAANGSWPTALDIDDVEVFTTPSLFEASTVAVYPDGSKHEWHISGESLIWEDESYELRCVRGECEFRPDFGSPNIDLG